MIDFVVAYLQNFPAWLAVILLSLLPVMELRLAIPIAITSWSINPINVFGLAIIGNIIPFFPLFFGLKWLRIITVKYFPMMTRVIDNQLDIAQKKVEKKYARYGALALFLFTALPLPFTGLWTATLAAVALRVPLKYSIIGIFSGVVVAGIIVSLLTVGISNYF